MKKALSLLLVVLLSACSSNPISYLPTGTQPILNVESEISDKLKIDAQAEKLEITNLTDKVQNIAYKLFWYDSDGVTQISPLDWQDLSLDGGKTHLIMLNKPTKESANYRIYVSNRK